MSDRNRARQKHINSRNHGYVQDYVLVRVGGLGRNDKRSRGAVSICHLNQYFTDNIEETKFKQFVNRSDKLECDYASQFIGFPLGMPSGLLNDQYIAKVASKTRSTVARTVNRASSVEQARIAVWHVATTVAGVDAAGRYSDSVLSPLKCYICTRSKILIIKGNIVEITNTCRCWGWSYVLWWIGAVARKRECVCDFVSNHIDVTTVARNSWIVGGVKASVVYIDRDIRPIVNTRRCVCEGAVWDHIVFLVTSFFMVSNRVCSSDPFR